MSLRLKLAGWFALSFVLLAVLLLATAHRHLDEVLREDRWDRAHPQLPERAIRGSYTDAEVADILGELLKVWISVGLPAVLGSVAVGYLIARRSLKPVARINRELDTLQAGDLRRGVTMPEKDAELRLLVDHLNALLARVAGSLEQTAEFSAKVAHELRTPLAIMRLRVEAAAAELPPDFSEHIQQELHRLSRLVDTSLLMARAEAGRLETDARTIDVALLLEELHDGYSVMASERAASFEWRVPQDLPCLSDPDILRRILHGLLDNAVRHGGRVIRVSAFADASGRTVVRISNLASPERTTSAGTGLGLRLTRALASALRDTNLRIRRSPRSFCVRLALRSS